MWGISLPGSSYFLSCLFCLWVWKALQQQEQVKAFTSGISGLLSTHSVFQPEVCAAKVAHWFCLVGHWHSWCLLYVNDSAQPKSLMLLLNPVVVYCLYQSVRCKRNLFFVKGKKKTLPDSTHDHIVSDVVSSFFDSFAEIVCDQAVLALKYNPLYPVYLKSSL